MYKIEQKDQYEYRTFTPDLRYETNLKKTYELHYTIKSKINANKKYNE